MPAIGDAGIEPTRSDCRKPTAVQIAVLVSSCREQTPRLLYEISGADSAGTHREGWISRPPTRSAVGYTFAGFAAGRQQTGDRVKDPLAENQAVARGGRSGCFPVRFRPRCGGCGGW